MSEFDPPFDGKPCPFCPVEIRNLAAVAHNLLTVWDDPNRRQMLAERIDELRRAVKLVEPLSDAHFADEHHSHRAGQVRWRCTTCPQVTDAEQPPTHSFEHQHQWVKEP